MCTNFISTTVKVTLVISCLLVMLYPKSVKLMSTTECAGKSMTVTCGSPDWLVHILYETYIYVENPQCSTGTSVSSDCSDTEFLNAISMGYCNGNTVCTFMVPSDRFLMACYENATLLTVHYDCIPKVQVFNMCSNFTYHYGYSLYLMSPGYPGNKLLKSTCECSFTGTEINGFILEHEKDGNSPVVMIISTDSATYHVNSVHVLNTRILSNVSKVTLLVDNRYSIQNFKLWMGFKGYGMTLICGAGDPIKPTTVTQISTTVHNSSYFKGDNSLLLNSSTTSLFDLSPSFTTETMKTIFVTTMKENTELTPSFELTGTTSTQTQGQGQTKTAVTLTDQIKTTDGFNKSKGTTQTSPTIYPTKSSSSPSSSSTLSLSSLPLISSTVMNSTEEPKKYYDSTDNTDLYLIIAICCILFILLIAIIVLAVLAARKVKIQHSAGYNLEGDDIIYAFGSYTNLVEEEDNISEFVLLHQ